MYTTDGQGILDGYLNLRRKVAIHLSLVVSLGKALNHLHMKWLEWNKFVQKRRRFEFTTKEKTGKKQFRFEDLATHIEYGGNLKNIHRSLVNHTRIAWDYQNYKRFNTRGLINCMETGIINFFFKECKALLADGVNRFLIKSRAGIQFTLKRKLDSIHTGNGLYGWGEK
jgi:hypothetical protein